MCTYTRRRALCRAPAAGCFLGAFSPQILRGMPPSCFAAKANPPELASRGVCYMIRGKNDERCFGRSASALPVYATIIFSPLAKVKYFFDNFFKKFFLIKCFNRQKIRSQTIGFFYNFSQERRFFHKKRQRKHPKTTLRKLAVSAMAMGRSRFFLCPAK